MASYAIQSLWQLLRSAVVVWKQPQTLCKLYLQRLAAGQIWSVGHRLPTLGSVHMSQGQ